MLSEVSLPLTSQKGTWWREKFANHFNSNSGEFDGLAPEDVPTTYSVPMQVLMVSKVAGSLRKFKKPKSMV